MPNLHAEFAQFVLKRNRTQSPQTRKDRLKTLRLFTDELAMLGYGNLGVADLEKHHVQALVTCWQQKNIAAGTLVNRLATLRWWASNIGKKDVVSPDNTPYGVRRELPYRASSIGRKTKPKTEAEVVQTAGKICHKCERIRSAKEFCKGRGMKDRLVSICNKCRSAEVAAYDLRHRDQKRAYDETHKLERRLRDLAREHGLSRNDPRLLELNRRKPTRDHLKRPQQIWEKKPTTKVDGAWVYIVQILGQANVVKIGHTTSFLSRIATLHKYYGGVEVVMAIPYKDSAAMERWVHQYFNDMRVYANGFASELFRFDTRKKQRVLEQFLAKFSSFYLTPIRWENHQETLTEAQDAYVQMGLFSSEG